MEFRLAPWRAAATLAGVLCASALFFFGLTPALASPVEAFGANPRSGAMVGAMTASSNDADAVFYNPAALTRAEPGLGVAFLLALDQSKVRLMDRPEGYDIPNLGGSGPAVPTASELESRRDTGGLPPMGAMGISWVTSLGLERFRIGVLAVVPVVNGAGQPTWFPDERERLFSNRLRYEILGERIRRFDIQAGMGWRPTERLSLGASIGYLPRIRTTNNVYLADVGDQSDVDLAVNASQGAALSVRGGVHFQATDWLALGISYRSPLALRLTGSNELRIRGFEDDPETWPVTQEIELTPFYSPATVAAGAAVELGRFTLAPDVSLHYWSSYVDRQNQDAHFSNTISPRLGVEYGYSDDLLIRTGLAWEPSPVPDQTGRTNYVDNSRLVGGFGTSSNMEIFGAPLTVSWMAQIHYLLPRTTRKAQLEQYPDCAPGVRELCDELPDSLVDPRTGEPRDEALGLQTGNPGFPGWVSGGWIGAVGVEVSWRY